MHLPLITIALVYGLGGPGVNGFPTKTNELTHSASGFNLTELGLHGVEMTNGSLAQSGPLTRPQEKALAKVPLNFKKDVPRSDRHFYDQAYDDAIRLARAGVDAAKAGNPAFDRYFGPGDNLGVKAALSEFINAATEKSGKSKIRDVVVMNGDESATAHICISPKPPIAYMDPKGKGDKWYGPGSKIHACKSFYQFDVLSAHNCDWVRANWRRTTEGMSCTGSNMLHEWMHYDDLVAHANGMLIEDQTVQYNGQTRDVYGAFLSSLYRQKPLGSARNNADNFVWFTLEAFWTQQCDHLTFGPPVDESNTVQVDGGYPVHH